MASVEHGKGSKKPRMPRAPGGKVKLASTAVSSEERYAIVAQAAYLRALERDFAPGRELDDWLAAEAETDMRLAGRQP